MMAESNIAPFLTQLHEEYRKQGVRVGSCQCPSHLVPLLS